MELLFLFLLIFFVVFFSALVSGSEAALLSLSLAKAKDKVREYETLNKFTSVAHSLVYVKENIKRYITTIVVLNNIINIIGSIYVGVFATQVFGEVYLGVISGILTFLIILFSEIIPKVYGERYSLPISLIIVRPLMFFTFILTPIIMILERLTSFFIKDFQSTQVSEGEIKEMAMLGMREGSINQYENEVIENVFRMNDVEVYDIMVPKHKVTVLDKTTPFDEIINLVNKTGYTRFPIQNSKGDIIGVINTKDLFSFHGQEKSFTVDSILRPVVYAPETMKASTLELKFKKNRIHMAIVVNEHGDFLGIVTLEDIIEELVGDIEDEFDPEENDKVQKIDDNTYHIDASIEISDLNEQLDLNINEEASYATLNGFLIDKKDEIPRINDIFYFENGRFRVIKRTKRKVSVVEFILNSEKKSTPQ